MSVYSRFILVYFSLHKSKSIANTQTTTEGCVLKEFLPERWSCNMSSHIYKSYDSLLRKIQVSLLASAKYLL